MGSRVIAWAVRRRGTAVTATVLAAALAGTAFAAAPGTAWKLGVANTITGYMTSLAGSYTGSLVSLRNDNTGSSAKALTVVGKSTTGSALHVSNPNGGPALSLAVTAGKAPFTTNSGVKVTNLNADKLDGLDQSAFARGVAGKANNADKLDGIDSTGFYAAGSKVADSAHADHADVADTATTATNATNAANATNAGNAGNADKLDGIDSPTFLAGRVLGAGTGSVLGSPVLVSGYNHIYAVSLTASSAGTCQVNAATQISTSAANAATGPYYRIAIKRGTTNLDDSVYGHYFPASAAGVTEELSRSANVSVAAGETIQLGAYFGNVNGDWVGDSPYIHLNYICFSTPGATVTSTSVSSSKTAPAGLPDQNP